MTASLAQIRAAIVGILSGVPEVGRVHDRERYANNLGHLKALYAWPEGPSNELRGWYLRRLTSAVGRGSRTGDWVSHQWQLRGFMSFDDAGASELVFDSLVEDVRAAFHADPTLGGVVFDLAGSDQGDLQVGVRVVESAPVMFAGVLCHSADLRFFTRHYDSNPDDEE